MMVKYKNLAALLKTKFPGLSQRKIADRLGVEHTSVARWFRTDSRGQPSMDSCLRIAKGCGVDPHEVFQLAGFRAREFSELFDFFQGRPACLADIYAREPGLAQLAARSETLFRRGMEGDLDKALVQLEQAWEVRRIDFELMLKECDAEAGCLLVDHPGCRDDVFYQINCRRSDLERLSEIGGPAEVPEGWRLYLHQEFKIRLRLFVRRGEPISEARSESTLHLWSFGFSRLLKPAQ